MDDLICKLDLKSPLIQNPISYVYATKNADKIMLKKKYNRIVGTPDYIAPEIIENNLDDGGFMGPALDWWSIGVILFEFLVGLPPFNDDTIEKIFENISKHAIPWDQIEVGYEEQQMSPEAQSLINMLLNAEPNERLGTGSVEDIKKHAFFKGF